jgi:arabinogalactan oligomer/maltooligosaccharide transport system permease protein
MTRYLLGIVAVLVVAVVGVVLLVTTGPEAIVRDRFLVVPGMWWRALLGFGLIAGGISLSAYWWGMARRPTKAASYALTAATHMLIWLMILATLYPVVYLVAVSFNRNNTLSASLPDVGNLLARSGVLPNPADFSFVQYANLLADTHLLWYQWLLVAVLVAALVTLVVSVVMKRTNQTMNPYRIERLQRTAGWIIFGSAGLLVLSINPSQFFGVGADGTVTPSTSERKVILYIRNTLLVSGVTGVFAVLISTTAGYAFARMRFEGRYQTLLTFVFVQMFPGFMALVAIFYMMSALDLLNSFAGLILAYSGGAIAFAAWIFKGYLESISPSLEEAAMVDGATRWGAFWRVILPISVPMLLFIFLLQFIGTYSEFIMAQTLLGSGGDDLWTVGIGLRSFSTGRFSTAWGAMAATAVLGSIPILLIFYAFQDALTGQTTAGGVKG